MLGELRRLNLAQVAAHSALHCVISTVGADKESSEENYNRLQKNRNLHKRMLHFEVDEDDEKSVVDKLIADWYRIFGNKKDEQEETE